MGSEQDEGRKEVAEEDEKENGGEGGGDRDKRRRMGIMVVTCPRAPRGGDE